jgi:hypothetical protein
MSREYYLLLYRVTENYLEQRAQYRKEHLLLAQESARKGDLVLAGALEDPADSAVLVFYVDGREVIENFVQKDPYVRAGLVTDWKIRKYKVVIGTACEKPIAI